MPSPESDDSVVQSVVPETAGSRHPLWPGKLRAVAVHFGLSLLVFFAVMYLILTAWFPGFHFLVDGGWQGMRILIGVDLVLGPLLTLIVFDSRKSRRMILFDLSCIATAQVLALAWGIHAIHSQRVAARVFFDVGIMSVRTDQLAAQQVDASILSLYSMESPPLIYARLPKLEDGSLADSMIRSSLPLYSHFHLFQPWPDHFATARDRASLDIQALMQKFPQFGEQAARWSAETGQPLQHTAFFDYYGRYDRRVLAFDGKGKLLGSLPDYDPVPDYGGPPI